MKTVYFDSKENNNKRREDFFLKLSPSERVASFFALSRELESITPVQHQQKNPSNFILKKNNGFDNCVEEFIRSASKHNVRMIMVGGTAVNFHGYQRHSADVDFWIEITDSNLNALKEALNSIGYEFTNFPDEVKNGLQNISLKISPYLEIELNTRFSLNKQFSEVYDSSSEAKIPGTNISYKVLALEDLITSKALSGRNKDLIDIQELKRINKIT